MPIEKPPTSNEFEKEKTSPTKEKNRINAPKWIKTAVLGLSIAGSSPSFSQNFENKDEKPKHDTELLQEISSSYAKTSETYQQSLRFVDFNDYSEEQASKLKKEIENNIKNYKELAANPEKIYENLINLTDSIKSGLIVHFSSSDFLNKLQQNLKAEDAIKKQQEIIDNLNSVKVAITTPDHIKELTDNEGRACYGIKEHTIYIPFINFNNEIIGHELLHSAYRATGSLSDDDVKILYELFKKNKAADNEYQRNPAERIVRKKILDFELERLGIKKYNEKFTEEHYHKLLELKDRNNLGRSSKDIMDTVTKKQLMELMNTIAFEDASSNMLKNTPQENVA